MLFPHNDKYVYSQKWPTSTSHRQPPGRGCFSCYCCFMPHHQRRLLYTKNISNQIRICRTNIITFHILSHKFKLPGPSQGQELHNKIFVPSPVSLSWSLTQITGHQEPSLKSVHALSLSHGTIKQVSLGTRPVRPLGAWLLGIRL